MISRDKKMLPVFRQTWQSLSWIGIVTAFCFILYGICLPQTATAAFYNIKDEIEIGRNVSKEVEKIYKLSSDKGVQERVERLGRQLATVSERPELPYTFKVLEVNEVNAFALPGGPVYVFKGLADYMTDDELAGVIGHEIGHIVKRHSIKQMEKSMSMGLLMLLVLRDKGMGLQTVVQQAIMASYSREDEREADYQGFLLTTKAALNPYGMQMGLTKLATVHDAPDHGLFNSHPEPEARVALLKGYIVKDNIRPRVIIDGGTTKVSDGKWSFGTDENSAYNIAGALYRVSCTGQVIPDWFILDNDGDEVRIYYDAIKVWTVTSQEAAVANVEKEELASRYVTSFRQWAEQKQKE